ncbi:hypothetical protein JNW88_32240 [Micromonospora sp. ATA32]|nr:hypothetical protein [Micromonospora sp. ATA32]
MVDVASQAMRHRATRVERFAENVSEEAQSPLEELLIEAADDPAVLEVLARTVETASRSLDEWKIRLLARIFVSTTRDDAVIDSALILTDAVRQLEAPHVRLLALLASRKPDHLRPIGLTGEDSLELARWTDQQIWKADPGLVGVYEALIGRLTALGLIANSTGPNAPNRIARWVLTELGRMCARHLSQRAATDAT